MDQISFIIPSYNEEDTIINLVNEINSYYNCKIIIVDDGSLDNTFKIIPDDKNIIKIRNCSNMGKGYSIKRALQYTSSEYICIIDGDVSGAVKNIYDNMNLIQNYDCIVFTPPIKGGGFGIVRNYASYLVRKETGLILPWCISGVRILKYDILNVLKDFLDDGFGFEVSMTIQLIINDFSILNINSDFNHRITVKNLSGFNHRFNQFIDIYKYKKFPGK